MMNLFKQNKLLAISWFFVLLAIPLVSCFGRPMQHFLSDTVGIGGIAWILGSVTGILLVIVGVLLKQKAGWAGLLHLIWILLVVAGLMFYLRHHPERWYHIPLFGSFGFLSVSLFSVRTGAEVALALAVLDELFQHYLPDRVGDFEDVAVNAVCAVLGITLYLVLRRKGSRQTS